MIRLFSIKELERLSGVKAHTIRTWEKRFNIIEPGRMQNNTRLYTLDDVCTIMGVNILLDHGHKISKLAALNKEDIDPMIAGITTTDARQQQSIRRLVYNMFSGDTEAFENDLDDAVLFFGIDITVEDIIMPFLEKVNLLSYSDTTIETHFAVTAIRRKLILGIEKVLPQKNYKKSALLFLQEGEHYDLVLLYMCFLLKRSGVKVYYLGTNISLKNLGLAIADKRPDFLCSYVASKKSFPAAEYATMLSSVNTGLLLFATYVAIAAKGTAAKHHSIIYCKYNLLIDTLYSELHYNPR